MSRNSWLLCLLIIVCLFIFAAREAGAAEVEPDIIVLDDSCRLIKKPVAVTKAKKSNFVVQFRKPKPPPAAKAASAPEPAAAAPVAKRKPTVKRKSVLPPSIAAVPADYELNCDESTPFRPLASVLPPPDESAPFTPVPIAENEPSPPILEMTVTPLPPIEYEVTGEPPPVYVLLPPSVYIGPPAVVYVPVAPVPAVPEPELWALFLAGLGAVLFITRRNGKA